MSTSVRLSRFSLNQLLDAQYYRGVWHVPFWCTRYDGMSETDVAYIIFTVNFITTKFLL